VNKAWALPWASCCGSPSDPWPALVEGGRWSGTQRRVHVGGVRGGPLVRWHSACGHAAEDLPPVPWWILELDLVGGEALLDKCLGAGFWSCQDLQALTLLDLPWRRGRRVISWLRGVLFPWPAAVGGGDGDSAKLSSCSLVLVLSQATADVLLQCSASLVEV
jgi:hypothetical protein